MNDPYIINEQFIKEGFAIVDNIFTNDEVDHLLQIISTADTSKPTFRKTGDLFAIRQFFIEFPELPPLVFNQKLSTLISDVFGKEFFVVKSIYFDKPEASNWFVSYHQDLTISVDKKVEKEGFGPWTVKQNQFAVQPPRHILEENFTIRIHLDDTDEKNGALKVITKSHNKGIYRPETINWNNEEESICCVKKRAVMLMKPLLLHSSGKTTNKNKRRVIHIEFSKSDLPNGLKWSEFLPIKPVEQH